MRKDVDWIKTEEYFLPLAEIEIILSVSAQCLTFVQYEKSCASLLGVSAKQIMIIKLRNQRMSTIDVNKVIKIRMTSRTNKHASFVSLVGQETKQRANLETEQRFCGNKGLHQLLVIGFIIFSAFLINVSFSY